MYKLIRPFFFSMEPERAHGFFNGLGIRLAHSPLKKLVRLMYGFEDKRLTVEAFGATFSNPIGLAAGFDKNAKLFPFLSALGFGFTEIGSVSAQPAPGNPKPRLFRLPADRALINRMGLNNEGAQVIAKRIQGQTPEIPLVANIVKTNDPAIMNSEAVADFCSSFETLQPLSALVVLNISCPNSPDGRTFEDPAALDELLTAIRRTEHKFPIKKPVLVKLSPDLGPELLDQVLTVTAKHHISGYVIANTSVTRAGLTTAQSKLEKIGKGGLSGEPVRHHVVELISTVYKKLNKPLIIGCGGVSSAQDAYAQIKAGAALVELYTGLIYEGPGLVKKIKKGLVKLLEADRYATIADAVGKNV